MQGTLRVKAFWPEAGVKLTKGRLAKLEAELDRLAGFAGCEQGGISGWVGEGDFGPAKRLRTQA
jgi:uncharacterized protein YcaQ